MMKRAVEVLAVSLFAVQFASASYGSCAPGSRFTATGGHWKDCNGVDFVPRGLNLQYGDNPGNALPAFTPIAGQGVNAIRIELRTFTSGDDIKKALDAVLSKKMIPLLMLWDQSTTCGGDWGQLDNIIANWNRDDWKQVILDEQYSPYVLLNPVNEWSNVGSVSRTTYRDAYADVIKKMRSYGYNHTLAIDGYHCGQYADSFTYYTSDKGMKIGDYLFSVDPLRNLFFAYHAYGYGGNLDGNIDQMANSGWPWMITEHGNDNPAEIWKKTHDYGAGVLAWSWHGNGDGSGLDMNCDYASVCLSGYGNQVINGAYGVHDTAKQCDVFNGPAAPTHAPAPTQSPPPTTPAPACTDIAPDNTYTCAQQASWGKCSESWMNGFCLRSCGKCGGGCTDIAPDNTYTCAQQASWGKCSETWMNGFCLRSCGKCNGMLLNWQ